MLAANPRAYIRLLSASYLDDTLSAMLAEDQTAVSVKLDQHLSIIICTFPAYDFVFTKYPRNRAMGRGGIALSHLLLPQI